MTKNLLAREAFGYWVEGRQLHCVCKRGTHLCQNPLIRNKLMLPINKVLIDLCEKTENVSIYDHMCLWISHCAFTDDLHLIGQKEEPLLRDKPDHILHWFSALNMTCRRYGMKTTMWYIFIWLKSINDLHAGLDFTTWGISRVNDIQSDGVIDSLCKFQRSMQLLHLQRPALLLTEVVGNGNCSQTSYGQTGSAVAWQWSQYSCLGWTLAVHQDFENVLISTVKRSC